MNAEIIMRIGGHVSIAGGYANALIRAREIGANCAQFFSSSPRIWKMQKISDDQIKKFNLLKKELEIDPIYFHASYLINLADSDRIGELSKESLVYELGLAEELGVLGTIIHLGSYGVDEVGIRSQGLSEKRFEILIRNIQFVLDNTAETYFIIENAGNKKIGVTLDEIGRIVHALNSSRLKVCLDTCHLWGGGYDLSTQDKFNSFFQEFNQKIGLDRLEVFQINDSKEALGSFRDRHENIGEGNIPLEEFKLLFNDEKTKTKPFILEVPGADHKSGPDTVNIEKLKSLISTNE
jgi:apurinic endonuclease APN1